jgi:glycosyltransferase involved in cell wall biosynthesis
MRPGFICTFLCSVKKVLIISPYPKGMAPSQRFRYEQYLAFLETKGIQFEFASFLTQKSWNTFYKKGHYFKKFVSLLVGWIKRYGLLLTAKKFDAVFIHREMKPFGFPFFEWIFLGLHGEKSIYDFDDAIWLPNFSHSNRRFAFLKRYGNVKFICKRVKKVSVGNDFLKAYARQFNSSAYVIPTTIDTDGYHNQVHAFNPNNKIKLGWTGSHSTVSYLEELKPVFIQLSKQINFELIVISDKKPNLEIPELRYFKWDKATEIKDLNRIDIGLMPIGDSDWDKGKCGFKALQYMSLGIPALVSPYGVNKNIVKHGRTGYHCETESDWVENTVRLTENLTLLEEMGKSARLFIENNYSVNANKDKYLHLFS